MLITLALIVLLTFITLFSGEKLPNPPPEAEARALIKQYDNEEQDPARQAERDTQLYHELAAILHNPIRQKRERLPIIAIPLFITASIAASTLWYQQNGQDALKWHRLETALSNDIRKSQIYGAEALKNPTQLQNIFKHTEQAQFFPDSAQNHNVPLLYCQALQRNLERSDNTQLQALGNCYSAVGEYRYAEPVYDRLMHLQPDDPQTILAWAQTKTLAHPEQPIADDVQNVLIKLNHEHPNNPITQLFLASAYQQRGEIAKAIPLWQHLQSQLQTNDPLYPAVSKALAAATQKSATTPTTASLANKALTVHIHINPAQLQNLPASAKLFLIAGSKDTPMPTAVKTLPLQAEQTATLSDADSMQGNKIADTPNLELRLKLSPQGTATDPQAITTSTTPLADGSASLNLP